jgi:hypothetical protein
MLDPVYKSCPAAYAAIVQAEEARITKALAATPTHRLYLPAAILTFRQAALPLLDTVSAELQSDLSPDIMVDHLRVRAKTVANVVIDQVSARVAEAQRFASARFRDAVEVARRSHLLGALSGVVMES